jgi:hypothetical protein
MSWRVRRARGRRIPNESRIPSPESESRLPTIPIAIHNYVALPRSEAFRIEYWALEEAKLRRQPPDREFSRTVALVVGGGSGIGREVALELAGRGAHVVVADRDLESAEAVWTTRARDRPPTWAGRSRSI